MRPRDLDHPYSQNYSHMCDDCAAPCYPKRCADGGLRCDECIAFNEAEEASKKSDSAIDKCSCGSQGDYALRCNAGQGNDSGANLGASREIRDVRYTEEAWDAHLEVFVQ
jgi:hypothetical protein